MSTVSTRLVIFLIIFCATVWGCDEDVTINTSEEFSGIVKENLQTIQNETLRKTFKQHLIKMKKAGIATGMATGIATGMATGMATGIAIGRENSFMAYFSCGIRTCKRILEKPFDAFKPIFKMPEIKSLLLSSGKKELSDDILRILKQNDEWVPKHDDTYDFKTTTTESYKPTCSIQENYVLKVTDYYNKWLVIFKADEEDIIDLPFYFFRLKIRLYDFYIVYRSNYNNFGHFCRKVAECYARTYPFMSSITHNMLEKLEDYARANPDLKFPDVLFHIIPSWYLTEEQVTFINILMSALDRSKNFIPLKSVLLKNKRSKQEEENQWVVIPYDDSRKCGSWNVDLVPTTTPQHYTNFKKYIYPLNRILTKPQ